VLGIITAERKVLICRRRQGDAFGGLWEFPGGKREKDESIERCLARELAEELGITVRITAALDPLDFDYPNQHVRLVPILCTLESGEPQALASQELRWVPLTSLRDFKFPEANERLISEITDEFGTKARRHGGTE
jgi:mutator protein MutT